MNQPNLSSFIWSVADLLRGDYKQSEYGKIILPFTVLRRLDCVLEGTKEAVLKELVKRSAAGITPEPFLLKKSGQLFYNTSPLDMKKLMGDQDHIKENLFAYVQGFSPSVKDIFECFDFHTQVDRLAKAGLLYLVSEKFANIDLHPEVVSNTQMGTVFEELIRKFAELSNETAGEHMSPREVIRLMVNLLFVEDSDALIKPGVVRSLYDPTVATGGMLSVAEEHLGEMNPDARLVMFGQELNAESYAICKADMLIKGHDIANIILGNTLSNDGLIGKFFDYMLSNPPSGWNGRRSKPLFARSTSNRVSTVVSVQDCPESATVRSCSSCILFRRCVRPRMEAADSASSSMAHHSLPVAQARAKAKFAATFWKTIYWKRLSDFQPTCSTTPGSALTFGSSATASRLIAKASCN